MRRIVIFDCDGTLVDSGALILAAMAGAFESLDLPPPPAVAVRNIIGLSLDEATRRLVPTAPPALIAELASAYRTSFARLRADDAYDEPLFPGMAALLDALEADDRLLAIATGKSRRGVDHLIAKHGLQDRFASIQTADINPSKPHPAMLNRALEEIGGVPEDAAMIGDTSYDIEMAMAAGVLPIGVAWGHHDVAHLEACGAVAVAEDSAALQRLLLA